MHSDADGVPLAAGNAVTLLRLPKGMTDDLPPGEAAFLGSLVGGRVVVEDLHDHGVVEIGATDSIGGIVHFVYLLGHHLRLAD